MALVAAQEDKAGKSALNLDLWIMTSSESKETQRENERTNNGVKGEGDGLELVSQCKEGNWKNVLAGNMATALRDHS